MLSTCPRCVFSGTVPELNDIHSASFSGTSQGVQVMPRTLPSGQNYSIQFVKLMASATLVIRLGRLHMREFQFHMGT